MGKKNIAVDVDGVLAQYSGWDGLENIGDPIEGAREFLTTLQEKYRVVIFTTRCNVERNINNIPQEEKQGGTSDPENYLFRVVRGWLDRHSLPYDDIYVGQGKPIASAIIDDRAVACRPQIDPQAFQNALWLVAELDGMYDKK